MKVAVLWPLIVIFLLLSSLHFYWALGGRHFFHSALPQNEEGLRILNPSKIDCTIVGLGLLAFASFYLFQTGFLSVMLPRWILISGKWLIPTIFLFRAIGDFRYVGFFKRVVSTEFASLEIGSIHPFASL